MPPSPNPARRLLRGAVLAAALAIGAPRALAQAPGALTFGPVEPEVRADAVVGDHRQAYHLGLGAFRAVGRSARVGVVGGAGAALRDAADGGMPDDDARFGGRAELVARFTLRTSGAGRPRLYVGAGAGAMWASGESGRGVAHLLVGVQGGGPRWEHAAELGLGGGVRLGVALRRAR